MPNPRTQAAVAEARRRQAQRPKVLSAEEIQGEMRKCRESSAYFIRTYCHIYDNGTAAWILFDLWERQAQALERMEVGKYHLLPKSRQIGITWLGVVRILHRMLFKPIREVLVFSQRDDEAIKILERLRGVYDRLPKWMQQPIMADSAHEFRLGNGSRVQALPAATGGRSNAATDVMIDEADFIEGLSILVSNVQPTIDAGDNQLVLLSTINEETPNSYFQQLCKIAEAGDSVWKLIFLGWDANPKRSEDWYEQRKRETLLTYGTLDPLYKHYPRTLSEALAPRELNKRFPPQWIMALTAIKKTIAPKDAPAIPGLRIYVAPIPGHEYSIGADPGGGKVDKSAAQVVDKATLEQVAVLTGLIEPTQFANYVADLSLYYFRAAVLFELNNHGHAFLAQAKERSMNLVRGMGRRGNPDRDAGWLTTERSKHMLYDSAAKAMQQSVLAAELSGAPPIPMFCDQQTVLEVTSIDVSNLSAPEGEHDDLSMAWVLAIMAFYRASPGMELVSHNLWTEHAEAKLFPLLAAPPLWEQDKVTDIGAKLLARGIYRRRP